MGRAFWIRSVFIFWIMAITIMAVIPHADDGIMVSTNVTTSGMEKHIAGYFVAALLCYYAYAKKNEGHRAPQLNPLRAAPLGAIQQGREGEVFWKDISFILVSGLMIFLYSILKFRTP